MRDLLIFFTILISLSSFGVSANCSEQDQYIQALEQEVEALRQIIQYTQDEARPMCLNSGEYCNGGDYYDICCSTGRYCNPGSRCP